MRITRIEVEEGFLDGLNLDFTPGLNVVIGPRGTGKTSLIELIRFALGSDPLTERARGSLRDTISAVLANGEVTVSLLNEADELITASRSGNEEQPRTNGTYRLPLVLAQNEVEALGLQPSSRLSLIDRFRPGRAGEARDISALQASVAALTSQIGSVARELHGLLEQATEIPSVRRDLAEAVNDESAVLKRSEATQADQQALRSLQDRMSALAGQESVLRRTGASIEGWAARIEDVAAGQPQLETAPSSQDRQLFDRLAQRLAIAKDALREQAAVLSAEAKDLDRTADALSPRRQALDAEARAIRQKLDEAGAGAGAITRRVTNLRDQLARAESILGVVDQRRGLMEDLAKKRRAAYADLEAARLRRFEERQQIADRINGDLAPIVRVTIDQSTAISTYEAALEAALRGSGLHGKTLVPLLARRFNPLDLAEAVESEDASTISKIANITLERAVRVVEALRESGTEELISAEIGDTATFALLDGSEFKSTESLSTGQRCTVVLSIVLTSRDAVVVLDQPEDHLDNAFVVETLVKSLAGRSPRAQTITTTHNPNIPVLGDANLVTVLGSDGSRGYVVQSRTLLDEQTIDAITRLMEGGREAFRRRALTYGFP